MANGLKSYSIRINGLTESIEQVKVLTGMLDELDSRIKSLEGRKVNISSPTMKAPTVDTGNNADLQEQSKILQQIEQTEQKIADTRSNNYQELIRLKDELKQVKAEQDAAAASAKLMENSYAENTMAGLKEQLKDIKRVLGETEIGSDTFNQLTKEANELNEKLKEIEKSYGQFGRNVGNYASAAEGFKTLKIQVGDVTREFDNAREALKALKNERDTLALMGEDFHDLDIAVKQLQSSIKDMSVSSHFMDNMLDTMQSVVAIASTAKGIGAVFGKDNEKIEETIKKLVALQNVLQGLETIQKQMQTNEGIGKWLSAGNNAINKFTTSLLGTKKAVEGVTEAQKTATVASKAFGVALKGLGIGLVISLITTLITKWDKINASINKSFPALEKFGGILGAIEGAINGVINAMGNMFEILERLIHLDFSGAWGIVTQSFTDGYQEIADEQVRIKAAADAEELKLEMEKLEAMYGEEVKYTQKYRQLLARRNQLLKDSYNPNTDEGKKSLKELEIEQEKEKKAYKDHAKEMARLQKESDRELTNLRISNMKEGLNKTLTQLEEERKARIVKARETGRNVREIEAEINKEYDRKELEAREEYAKKTEEVYRNMFDAIMQLEAEGNRRRLSMLETQSNVNAWNDEEFFRRVDIPTTARTYGTSIKYISDEALQNAEKYHNLLDTIKRNIEAINKLDKNTQAEQWKQTYEAIEKAKAELDEFIETTEGYDYSEDGNRINAPFADYLYSVDAIKKDIAEVFKARREALKEGYESLIEEQKANEEAMYQQRLIINKDAERQEIAQLDDNREDINDKILEWYKVEQDNLDVQYKDGIKTYEQYYADLKMLEGEFSSQMQKAEDEYYTQLEDIQKQHRDEEDNLDKEHWENLRSYQQQYYDTSLQEARDYQTAINNVMSLNPVYDSFGVFNWKANSDNIKEARTNIEQLMNSIAVDRNKLNEDFKNGLIDPEYYENTNREFGRMIETCIDDLATLDDEAKQKFPKFMESLQVYLQAFSQTLSSVLDAVWAAQDAAYEKEMEDIDKDLEELEEKLNKQKDLVSDYASSVDSIEDELSTARGDRRQELIDQLNAEKAAQREALREQQRIEKEQEKLKEKQEKLEEEQKKRQKQRDITSALINSAMAVSYALANPWPFPAVALAAAAAIQGAAQVAAIKAQKYATGGIIEGKSHAHGGVKVLGGTAEVEGGEFITNKYTTAKNAQLLEFINGKKKKIYLEDMIDFYTDGRMKRNIISASPNRRYADGGQLPTLRTDININNRILDAIESVANRPSYVSVVEIEDVSQNMRSVRAQAGLSE